MPWFAEVLSEQESLETRDLERLLSGDTVPSLKPPATAVAKPKSNGIQSTRLG